MATIDLTEAARRARAAGKSAEQFVRACFEGDPSVWRTPTPGGPVPIPYPNVSVAQRAGGLPDLRKVPGSPASPVGKLDPAPGIDAAIIAFHLAVVVGGQAGRTLTEATGDRLGSSGARLRMQLQEAAEKGENLQEAALTALLLGLASGYGMAVRPALETVLRQAEQSLGWQRGAVGPGQQPIARFLLQLVQSAMRAFGMTATAIAPVIFVVAIAVFAFGPVAVLVVIMIFVFGTVYSGRSNISLALLPARSSAISAALAAAFAAGVSVDAIVRTGLDFGARSARDWAEMVCEAWRQSPGRTALGDLVRSLRNVLGLTASVMAAVLRYKLESDALTIARELKKLDTSAHDVAVALHDAGFSAAEAARALLDVFNLSSSQMSLELQQAQYNQSEVASAVSNLFSKAQDVLNSVVNNLR